MTTLETQTLTRQVDLTIDGRAVSVAEGTTLLQASRAEGIDTPTLCYLETLTRERLRVCVVERRLTSAGPLAARAEPAWWC
jgi:predicted molibdopterin-dependent oxidoreductase YjgC